MKMMRAAAVTAPVRDVIGIMCAGAVALGTGAPCKAAEVPKESWYPCDYKQLPVASQSSRCSSQVADPREWVPSPSDNRKHLVY